MPKYLIERELPGAGRLTADELQKISQKSVETLQQLGTDVQWHHSYVAGDKIYCIYWAANEEIVYEHARLGGFPANLVVPVSNVIEPLTAELQPA